jgi:CRP-like cAMP-binding protein
MGTIWKVNGEDKYFKRESASRWAEYVNGQKKFEFEFLGQQGDSIYLRKIGWLMYLRLNSNSIIYGEHQSNLDKYLCAGSWVQGMSSSSDSCSYYRGG